MEGLRIDGSAAGEASKSRTTYGGTYVDLNVSAPVSSRDVEVPEEFEEEPASLGLRFVGPDPREEGRFCTIGIAPLDDARSGVRVAVDCSWLGRPFND